MRRSADEARPVARRAGVEIERIVPDTPEWDQLYPEHLQRYAFAAERLHSGARVLDAGCGVGYGAAFLADRGAASVVAVDLSEEALEVARARFARPAITWVLEDCQALEQAGGAGPYDLICNLENLEHLREPRRFLARAADLLAPGAVLVTSTPNRIGINRLRGNRPDARSANAFHEHEYAVAEFRALLLEWFAEVELAFQTFDPIERMQLEPALAALWSNPLVRLGRWGQRLRGRARVEQLEDLLPTRRYQILATDPGDALVITQLAVCRAPRGTRG